MARTAASSLVRPLAASLAVGVLVQGLTWRARPGLGWAVLVPLLLLVMSWRWRTTSRSACLVRWMVGAWAVTAAAAVAARASDWALVLGGGSSAIALLVFALAAAAGAGSVGELLGVARLAARLPAQGPAAAADAWGDLRGGLLDLVRGEARRLAVGLLVGLPVTAVVAVLLASEPAFAAAVSHGLHGSGDGASFALASAITGGAVLLGHAVIRRGAGSVDPKVPAPPPPLVPFRGPDLALETGPRHRGSWPWVLQASTLLAVLLQLAAVLAVFAVVTVGPLLRGHAWLQAPGTRTYAQAVHAGFVQMVVAVALVLVVVLGGISLVGRGDGAAGPSRVRRALTPAALLVLLLTAAPLFVSRRGLHLYEEAYGTTYLRILVAFGQLAMAGAVTTVALHVARPSPRGLGTTWVALGIVCGSLLPWFNADADIARKNLARTLPGAVDPEVSTVPLDEVYLGSLSVDAVAGLPAEVTGDCEKLGPLLKMWAQRDGDAEAEGRTLHDWRSRRGLLGPALAASCPRDP